LIAKKRRKLTGKTAQVAGGIVGMLGKKVVRHYVAFVLPKNLVLLSSLMAAKTLGRFVVVCCFMSQLFSHHNEKGAERKEEGEKENGNETKDGSMSSVEEREDKEAKRDLFRIVAEIFQQATQRSSPHIVFGFFVLIELVIRSPHSLCLADRISLAQSLSKLRLSQITPLFFDFSRRGDLSDFIQLLTTPS